MRCARSLNPLSFRPRSPLFAACALAALAGAAAAQGPESALPRVARGFISMLEEGRYADAEAAVAPAARENLSRESLEEAWRALSLRHGGFRSAGTAREEKLEEHRVVAVPLQFEQKTFDAKVVFNESGKIVGFLFAPARGGAAAAAAEMPAAEAAAVVEQAYTVVSGQFRLPGAVATPKTPPPFPVLILIPDAGANDRDMSVGPNKPFRDIAWGLASRGIASLRYDKRTLAYGPRLDARTLTYREEFVDDALAAVKQVRGEKRFAKDRVFVLGLGLAGQLVPAIGQRAGATRSSIPGSSLISSPSLVAGGVIMGGSARPLPTVMIDHLNHIANQDGVFTLQERSAVIEFQSGIEEMMAAADRNHPPVMGLTYNYLKALAEYDCIKTAERSSLPLFIAQGGRDCQVTVSHDFQAWKDGLQAREDVVFQIYPDLNHLFMAGEGKSYPSEYENPGHVDEKFIDDVAAWILRVGYDK